MKLFAAKRHLAFIAIVIFFLSFGTLSGQEVIRLSLENAIDSAMQNNYQIKRYKEVVIQKEYLDKASVGNFSPSIDVLGGYTYFSQNAEINMSQVKGSIDDMFGKYGVVIAQELDLSDESQQVIYDKITGGLGKLPAYNIEIDQQHYPNLNITAMQPLFLGGKIIAGKRFATAELEYAQQDLRKVRNNVISETIERYFGVILLEHVIRVRKDVVAGMKHHEHQAEKAIEIGVIPIHELLRAKVAVANAERDQMDDENKLELATLALKTSLGLEEFYTVVATDSMHFKMTSFQIENLKQEAYSSQPVFKMIEQKKVMVRSKKALETSEFMPQIAAWGEYGFFREEYPVIMPPLMIGVQAKLNIFHGFAKVNKLKATEHLAREVEAAEIYARKQVDLWVNKAYLEVLNKQERYTKMKPTIDLARRNKTITEKRFKEGLGKSIDVIDASLLYEAAVVEQLKTLYDYYLALADLYLATGNPGKVVG